MSQTPNQQSAAGSHAAPPLSLSPDWSPHTLAAFMSQFGLSFSQPVPHRSLVPTHNPIATGSMPGSLSGGTILGFQRAALQPEMLSATIPSNGSSDHTIGRTSNIDAPAHPGLSSTRGGLEWTTAGQKRTRPSEESEEESEGDVRTRGPRRTKRPALKKPLKMLLCGVTRENLTDEQIVVRGKLQELVREELQILTGITKTSFPAYHNAASANVHDLEVPAPASLRRVPIVQSAEQVVGPVLDLQFALDVDAIANTCILRRAAEVVWREQSDPLRCVLPHKDVRFTFDDVLGFAKGTFRSWKRRYQTSVDVDKAGAHLTNQRRNRMAERQRRLCDDRHKAWKEYHRRHGKDVRPLLEETGWMSAEESSLEDGTPNEQETYRKELAAAAGMSDDDIDDMIPIWGVIRPAWRSREVNNIMNELDAIRRQQRKAADSKRSRLRVKRIILNRVSDDPPVVAVYPFMLDKAWLLRHKAAHPENEVVVRDEEVRGFEQIRDEAFNLSGDHTGD